MAGASRHRVYIGYSNDMQILTAACATGFPAAHVTRTNHPTPRRDRCCNDGRQIFVKASTFSASETPHRQQNRQCLATQFVSRV